MARRREEVSRRGAEAQRNEEETMMTTEMKQATAMRTEGATESVSATMGAGFLPRTATAVEPLLNAREMREVCYRLAMRKARIPAKFRDATFKSFRADTAERRKFRQTCRDWTKAMVRTPKMVKQGLFLCGPTGGGKTHMAYAALKQLLWDSRREAVAWNCYALMHELRRDIDRVENDPEKGAAIEEALEAPILMLDDLGAEQVTEWSLDRLFQVVDGAINGERILLVTSNFCPGDPRGAETKAEDGKDSDARASRAETSKDNRAGLTERVGERIASRLVGHCAVVRCPNVDYRTEARG